MSVNNAPIDDLKRRHKKLIVINIIFFIVLIIYNYLIPSVSPVVLGIILLSDYAFFIQVIFIITYLAWLISLLILILLHFTRIRLFSIKLWPLTKLEIFSLVYTLSLIALWIYARMNSIDLTFYSNDIF